MSDIKRRKHNIMPDPSPSAENGDGETAHPPSAGIDHRRYRKIRRFFALVMLQIIVWDVVFRLPGLRRLRPRPIKRWRAVARDFRLLAARMGGVMIKLGQFLSTRVDILPMEITNELMELQDKAPPEDTRDIIARIEADFERPLSELFEWFSHTPTGAASLAQAHAARLFTGESVVVKVLRPGIDVQVETDLAALALVTRWLSYFKRIRGRVDLKWLVREFTLVTRRELDLEAEGRHIERFARDFKGDRHVCIPAVYWEYSCTRVLTMENVAYFKINDFDAIEAAGISRRRVAETLHDIYMKQIFETYFVHVDPHPGNLFLKPLPHASEIRNGVREFLPGEHVPFRINRRFQIVMIDFGMVAPIPERFREAMRTGIVALAMRDPRKLIDSFRTAGVLKPDADLIRLEQAIRDWFERIWGLRLGQLKEVAYAEASYFLKEYRDLLYDMPFQLQADFVFIGRAVGILAGMTTNMDPDFDPWSRTIPFARRYAEEELRRNWREWLREILAIGQSVIGLPRTLEQLTTHILEGKLAWQTRIPPETRKALKRIETSVGRFPWMVMSAGLLVSGVHLYAVNPQDPICWSLLGLAAMAFLWSLKRK